MARGHVMHAVWARSNDFRILIILFTFEPLKMRKKLILLDRQGTLSWARAHQYDRCAV